MGYNNPVISGFYPDPSVCCVGDDYYLVTSTFQYFPGVPIFHSKDLINWQQVGHCLTRESQLPLHGVRSSGGIYAPTIRHREGVFYMITTNVPDKGNFYVTATDPAGEWSEPIYVDQAGIDPSLYFDVDGKVYFHSMGRDEDGKHCLKQCEIDIKTGERLTESKILWYGTGGKYPEAPHIYRIKEYYYLMIAEGGTQYGHMITIARSKSPWGPFESCPHNPILTHRDTIRHEIQGTGHGDIVQAHDGSWWIVFLAYRNTKPYFHHLGRETFLAPVTWTEDGWPVVNKGNTIEREMNVDTLPLVPVEKEWKRDYFNNDKLNDEWNFIRNMNPNSWCMNENGLCLKGSKETLEVVGSPTFIGRRQCHWDCVATTKLVFNPTQDGEEAGLTTLYDETHHYEIAVILEAGQRYVIVRKHVGDMRFIAAKEAIDYDEIVLSVKANKLEYEFGFGPDEDCIKPMATALTQYVSTEVMQSSFTGVYIGLYATGNGKPSQTTACFNWFDYKPTQ